ncbi:MAG: hypothetical protein R3F11_09650 [Verrucomicrobiales bacterium]
MKARILIPLIAIAAACAADLANAQLASHLLAERQKVAHPDGPSYQDGFGATVAMSNGMLACSAWDDTAGENAGAVFIYRQESSGGWTFSQKIVPQPIAGQSDAAQFIFGTTIAMEGDTLLIGASGFGTGFQRYGALYYYQRQGDNWIFGARIEGNANRRIGAQVALDGDTLVTAQVGGAFVYERIGGTWTYRAELSPNEEPGSSQYGNAVAIGGDTIVVTARARQSGGFFSAAEPSFSARSTATGSTTRRSCRATSVFTPTTNSATARRCAATRSPSAPERSTASPAASSTFSNATRAAPGSRKRSCPPRCSRTTPASAATSNTSISRSAKTNA